VLVCGAQLRHDFPQVKILVAITGASGALYAQRLLDNLDSHAHEIHVVQSNYAQQVIAEEIPGGLRLPDGVKSHGLKSMNAPFASGSNPPDAMVVIPCTMGTMGRIAHGYSEDVLLRAADVVLKERKKLILVPRETPLSLVHVKNMTWWTPSCRACWTISACRKNLCRVGRRSASETWMGNGR
jgi:4-hydroxy-3-polyprenylbenzoate decarboxylase